jgi:ferredoxin
MSLSIKVDGRVITFVEQDKNILKSLERENIESHYHCRDGYCGACRCKLISGEVKYNLAPIAFVRDGDILTCCAQPLSNIEIDIHD